MSTPAENFRETNTEDQFFGVAHPVSAPQNEELDLEIVDDEQEQEQPAKPEQKADRPKGDDDDDDLTDIESELSDRVKRRIQKLTGKMRRAERDRDEAFTAAQTMHQKLQHNSELLSRGEQALAEQIQERAQLALDRAKEKYRAAYEEGDTDEIIKAQEDMLLASNELTEAKRYTSRYSSRQPARAADEPSAEQAPPQQRQQPRQPAQPDPRAQAWADENPWFGSPEHKAMTALAYGVHEELLANGVEPNSDEYFESINATVQRAFPDYFGRNAGGEQDMDEDRIETPVDQGGERQPAQNRRRSPSTPAVAPAGRNAGTRSNRISLTESQKNLARRLGLTNEQYAAQLLKETKR